MNATATAPLDYSRRCVDERRGQRRGSKTSERLVSHHNQELTVPKWLRRAPRGRALRERGVLGVRRRARPDRWALRSRLARGRRAQGVRCTYSRCQGATGSPLSTLVSLRSRCARVFDARWIARARAAKSERVRCGDVWRVACAWVWARGDLYVRSHGPRATIRPTTADGRRGTFLPRRALDRARARGEV